MDVFTWAPSLPFVATALIAAAAVAAATHFRRQARQLRAGLASAEVAPGEAVDPLSLPTAVELVELGPEEDIYRHVAARLKALMGEGIVAVTSYDPESQRAIVRELLGIETRMEAVLRVMGANPVGRSFASNEEARRQRADGRLRRFERGIYDLADGVLPESVCIAIEKLLGMGAMYSAAFVRKGEMFGSVILITPNGKDIPNTTAIEALVLQASVALRLREAAEALRQSEERFRLLAEHAQDLIYRYELRPVRRFSYVSPSSTRITGYTPQELRSLPDLAFLLIHPDDRPAIEGLIDGSVQPGNPQVVRWFHKDGRTVWTETSLVPIRDENGTVVALEGISRDVTERKQLEEQLLRAQRLETAGRIAGQVAHDFNNLLSPLVAYPELMKMELPEDHPALGFCDDMLQAARQMAEINEDMMTFGRRGRIQLEPTDLNSVVRQAAECVAPGGDDLKLDLNLAPDLFPARGAPAQLLRVVTNLLANAQDAIEETGCITVTTENVHLEAPTGGYNRVEPGEYVRLTVSDTGSGISVEIRDKLFDPFFTTKSNGRRRGSGLGLSVVQAIVDDHNGYVDLKSEVGRGTSFMVYLPTSVEPAQGIVSTEPRSGTESILLVDDDPLQREVIHGILRKVGYRVEAVSSGEEAIERLRNVPADLVVLDMIMPGGIDGTETYRRIHEFRPAQRAVVLSGFAESDRMREARALGVHTFLRKPVTVEQLTRAVREEIDRPVGVA